MDESADRLPRRRRALLSAALGAGIAVACAPVSAAPAAAAAVITAQHWLTPRTVQLTVATDAFAAPVPVEVTFPAGYEPGGARRWPVTYYLAGTAHDEATFRAIYDGETITADYPSLVVSPRGDAGFWSDWLDGSAKYETFVIDQLIPLIDASFATHADRAHRAIMGESMGGAGTLLLAARHPDEFAAAASLSGAADTNMPDTWNVVSIAPALQGAAPDAIYGPRASQEIRWRGHNPADLASNLAGVDLQLYTGNGVYDPAHGETQVEASVGCALESAAIHGPSVSTHERMLELGIAHEWVELPWGCHGVALFQYEMRAAITRFEELFADPAAVPESFDYRSIEPAFEVWGWDVRTDPARAAQFLDLHEVSARGLRLTGSGTTTVTTPPLFAKRAAVTVTVDGIRSLVTPDAEGRVTVSVDLGPADRQQQYTPGAVASARTAEVSFEG
ncbi:alpha/beta hydrolase-fold protein [Nocardia sp. NPDC005978]|uniref:alpha/beta hydrolase n=1 Tax=Nocardia sp. NPDC005978 TaxID=3156725 RepID=UPI0033A4D13E